MSEENQKIVMLVSKSPEVNTSPVAQLSDWSIHSCPVDGGGSTMHFCGNIDGRGRVSSPILNLDANTMSGQTASGRVYQLTGEPAAEDNVMMKAAWQAWAKLNQVTGDTDITHVMQQATTSAASKVRH